MQNNIWEITVQIISFLASVASLVLAVVAIWLSFKFYNMSERSSGKIEEATRAIAASVDRLERVLKCGEKQQRQVNCHCHEQKSLPH
jgi:Na+/melibiose symporter-like transporter